MLKNSVYAGCLCLILAVAGFAQASDEEGDRLDRVHEKGVLRVAVYRDFPPYSFSEQGHYRGIDVDVARALAKRMGLGVDLMPITADENMEDDLRNAIWKGHYLGGGVADVMMHVPVDHRFAEENRKVEILAPYLAEHVAVAVDAKRVEIGTDFMDLNHFKIGVELDTIADHYLSAAYGGRFRASLVRFLNVAQATDALRSGRVTAVVAPKPQIEYGLANAPADDFRISPIEMQGLFRGAWSVGLAVASGNPKLRDALANAMGQVRSDGTLRSIFAQYRVSSEEMAAAR